MALITSALSLIGF